MAVTGEHSFDLVTRPWIPVRRSDGTAAEVGLIDALVEAHSITGFDVEYPTQEPALLRLLLAICYRALAGPADEQEWRALWADEALPDVPIRSYLEDWSHRFDLFDAETPFFQTPRLETTSGKTASAAKLVPYAPSGNNVPLLTPLTDGGPFALAPGAAARWLIERHAWGTTSDKAGAIGNPLVKAGKDTPAVGHLASVGFVAPVGSTLKETLLLNLVPLGGQWTHSGLDDLPAWERPPDGPARSKRNGDAGGRIPAGVCDLYTWQGRRILLLPEPGDGSTTSVGRVVVCAGDDIARDSAINIDPHVGWATRTDKDGTPRHVPLRARTGQQVWRGLGSLLALGGTGTESASRAPVLSWLARVEDAAPIVVSLLTTSVTHGSMSSTVDDLLADRLAVNVSVLRQEDPAAGEFAVDCAKLAGNAAFALRIAAEAPYLAEKDGNLVVDKAKKDQAESAGDATGERLYAALDGPFRRMLVGLSDAEEERPRWAMTVKVAAESEAARILSGLPSSQALAAAVAAVRFRAALRKAMERFSPMGAGTTTEAA